MQLKIEMTAFFCLLTPSFILERYRETCYNEEKHLKTEHKTSKGKNG